MPQLEAIRRNRRIDDELNKQQNKMEKFYTITAVDSTHCNDRSTRHSSLNGAIEAASKRLVASPHIKGVVIMQSIKLVTPKPVEQPVIVEDIN